MTVLAQEKPSQETASKLGFIAAGLSRQPPARLQSACLTAPWVTSACRALLGLDLCWEFLRGTRLSCDHYFHAQVTIWLKSKLENEVITTHSLLGRQPAAAGAMNGVSAFYKYPFC